MLFHIIFAPQQIPMEESTISLIIAVLALLTALFTLLQKNRPQPANANDTFVTRPLRLQAYERLVLLCERIALPNLISRVSQPGFSAREMQMLLIESIKQEYEYNASQQ